MRAWIQRGMGLLAAVGIASVAMAGTYHTVDLSPVANAHFESFYGGAAGFPVGDVTLGGVPFSLPGTADDAWTANQGGSGHYQAAIPVFVDGVRQVHMLINTQWGMPGPTPYTRLEFTGMYGAYLSRDLYGDDDIRDWLQYNWTNNINGVTTTEVWSATTTTYLPGTPCRIDKLAIDLPPDFHDEVLTYVVISDWGGVYPGDPDPHRAFTGGLTVYVPEPLSAATIAVVACLAARRRRR